MAVTVTIKQSGDKYNGSPSVLAAHNPLLWIFEVTSTTSYPDLYLDWKFIIDSITYTFKPVNVDFDGSTGTFIFAATDIVSAMLNDSDDIIPSGDWAKATEMFVDADFEGNYYETSSSIGTEFYNGSLMLANAARDIGNSEGATLDDWGEASGESRIFYAQASKETYWYFRNGTTTSLYLEYTKVNSIPETVTLTNQGLILTNNGTNLTNTQ